MDFKNPSYHITLPEFIGEVAAEAIRSCIDEQEFWWYRRYVELVAGVFSGLSGCLLLTVTGSGQLSYASVDDIGDLIRTPELVMERHLKRQVELAREQQIQHEQLSHIRERVIEHEGFSHSF